MLEIGTKMPHFNAIDQNGNKFDSNEWVGKKILVVYFYPKNFTPGCNREACAFRDAYEGFKDNNVEVIGISGDSTSSHVKFAKKYNVPFILLSDQNKHIRKSFDVPSSMLGLLPGRVTFVIDKEGVIIHAFNAQFNPEAHVEETLKVIQELV